MAAAQQWVALTDGGNGLEKFVDVNFPGAAKVLDSQHAAGYVARLAKAVRPGAAGAKLLDAWCHTLKHAGGARLVQVLQRLDGRKLTDEARAELADVLPYLRRIVPRMDYPPNLRRGWQIASGAVESACKTVVNQRLCLGGHALGRRRIGRGGAPAGAVPQ